MPLYTNPHIGTTVIGQSHVLHTPVAGKYPDIGNITTVQEPFGRHGTSMVGAADLADFATAWNNYTPWGPFAKGGTNDKSEILSRANETATTANVGTFSGGNVSGGLITFTAMATDMDDNGTENGTACGRVYCWGIAHQAWRATNPTAAATSSPYYARLRQALLSFGANSGNNPLAANGLTTSSNMPFHNAAKMAQVVYACQAAGYDVLNTSELLATQNQFRRFAIWYLNAVASCALNYTFSSAQHNTANNPTLMGATPEATGWPCNGSAVSGQEPQEGGVSGNVRLYKTADGTRVSISRYCQGNAHIGGNQGNFTLGCAGQICLWLGLFSGNHGYNNTNAPWNMYQRLLAGGIAYTMLPNGAGWDMMRLGQQGGTRGEGNPQGNSVNDGGGAYFPITLMKILEVAYIGNRLGRTDSCLNWQFNTGLPAVGGSVTTVPASGYKSILNSLDLLRDMVAGKANVYADNNLSNVPTESERWPARFNPLRDSAAGTPEAQWFIVLLLADLLTGGARNYRSAAMRLSGWNSNSNAGDFTNRAHNFGAGRIQGPGTVVAAMGVVLKGIGTNGFSSGMRFSGVENAGVNSYTASGGSGGGVALPIAPAINNLTVALGQPAVAWTANIDSVAGGTVTLVPQPTGAEVAVGSVTAGYARPVSSVPPQNIYKLKYQDLTGGQAAIFSEEFAISDPYIASIDPQIVSGYVTCGAYFFGHAGCEVVLQRYNAPDKNSLVGAEITISTSVSGPAKSVRTASGSKAVSDLVPGASYFVKARSGPGGSWSDPSAGVTIPVAAPPPPTPAPAPAPVKNYATGFESPVAIDAPTGPGNTDQHLTGIDNPAYTTPFDLWNTPAYNRGWVLSIVDTTGNNNLVNPRNYSRGEIKTVMGRGGANTKALSLANLAVSPNTTAQQVAFQNAFMTSEAVVYQRSWIKFDTGILAQAQAIGAANWWKMFWECKADPDYRIRLELRYDPATGGLQWHTQGDILTNATPLWEATLTGNQVPVVLADATSANGWHKVEVWMNRPAGRFKAAINGVTLIDRTGSLMGTSGNITSQYRFALVYGPLLGGVGSNGELLIDDLEIYDSPPANAWEAVAAPPGPAPAPAPTPAPSPTPAPPPPVITPDDPVLVAFSGVITSSPGYRQALQVEVGRVRVMREAGFPSSVPQAVANHLNTVAAAIRARTGVVGLPSGYTIVGTKLQREILQECARNVNRTAAEADKVATATELVADIFEGLM